MNRSFEDYYMYDADIFISENKILLKTLKLFGYNGNTCIC